MSLIDNIELENEGSTVDGTEVKAYARWKLDKGELKYDIVDNKGKLILYTQNPRVDKLLGMIQDNFPDSCKQKGGFWWKKNKDKPKLSKAQITCLKQTIIANLKQKELELKQQQQAVEATDKVKQAEAEASEHKKRLAEARKVMSNNSKPKSEPNFVDTNQNKTAALDDKCKTKGEE